VFLLDLMSRTFLSRPLNPLFAGKCMALAYPDIGAIDPESATYFKNGSLASANLTAQRKIYGIDFSKGSEVTFREDGTVETVRIPEEKEVGRFLVPDRGIMYFYRDGKISAIDLAVRHIIKGIPCEADHTYIHKNGSAKEATLFRRHRFGKLLLPAQTGVRLDEQGKLIGVRAPNDIAIQGIGFKHTDEVVLHPNGVVKRGVLSGKQTIQGVPCRDGNYIEFDAKGKLVGANLAEDKIIQGVPCTRKQRWTDKPTYDVRFHSNGKIANAYLAQKHAFDGIVCRAKDEISFYPSGKLMGCTLEEGTRIDGIDCEPKEDILLYENGKVASIYVEKERVIHNVRCSKNSTVKFYKNGMIKQYLPASIVAFGEVICSEQTDVKFHPNGNLYFAELAAALKMNGVTIPSGSYVWFDQSGAPSVIQFGHNAIFNGKFYRAGAVLHLHDLKKRVL
jgi:hypothetical protein